MTLISSEEEQVNKSLLLQLDGAADMCAELVLKFGAGHCSCLNVYVVSLVYTSTVVVSDCRAVYMQDHSSHLKLGRRKHYDPE